MELIEAIRHAGDRQTRSEKIEEAAKKLGKSTRTIRRMVTKVEQEGLAALAETVRSDKGQLRTSLEWQEKIIKLYIIRKNDSSKRTIKIAIKRLKSTVIKYGQPARYIGVVQARDKTKPFSEWEQKSQRKKEIDEEKQLDKTSIYSEIVDRHQTVEN